MSYSDSARNLQSVAYKYNTSILSNIQKFDFCPVASAPGTWVKNQNFKNCLTLKYYTCIRLQIPWGIRIWHLKFAKPLAITPKNAEYMFLQKPVSQINYFAYFGVLPCVSWILNVIFGFHMEFGIECVYNTSILNKFEKFDFLHPP